MAYLLDTDTFIRAKNLHYGFDFCPAFWDWLIRENQAGRVFSIERVGDELLAGDDPLADWANLHSDLFLPADAATIPALGTVAAWVNQHDRYTPAAKNTFLQVADYYLIAQAMAGGHVVVTHEIAADSTKKIKIPNICLGLNVKCMNPYEMLRKSRARFVLGGR